ncbi:HigA family addiction module antitoxin [Chitinophaga sp. GCM10012297]|uniref:HigA family addiction module antidote protein n=1 Tax=Chitinophaga chungangae TaxID=2821488 RepID=A0ABS3Y8V2_9BACT|nr:HigA family addiction module antitoxin [Chitinophaga chungangae]MBO9151112.1 HigA family addiction module antidote protein [Chitinophaga chungangae]
MERKMKLEHPGILIKGLIFDEHGLSISNAAEMLGVTRTALSHLANGKADLSVDMSLRIEMVFGGTAEYWQRLQAAYNINEARPRIAKLKLKRYKPALKKPLPVKETKSRGHKAKKVA